MFVQPSSSDFAADRLTLNTGQTLLSVCVEPWYRYRQGKPVSVWPNVASLLQEIGNSHNVHCELVFGQRAVDEKTEVLKQIIDGRASSICGLVWMERPHPELIIDLSIEHPYLCQTIRLTHSDLNHGDSFHLRKSLKTWKTVGIDELLVPPQDSDSPVMPAWEEALQLILSHQTFIISPDRTHRLYTQTSDPIMVNSGHANLPHLAAGVTKDRHLLRQRLLTEEGLTA